MTALDSSRPSFGLWLLLLAMALWLALAPLAAVGLLSALIGNWPNSLVQLGLITSSEPASPDWAFGLLATFLTLGLQLLFFLPVWAASRQAREGPLHTVATLMVAIVLLQTLDALARLAWPESAARTALLSLALGAPFLFLGLGGLESRRHDSSLIRAWRRVGLRRWLVPSAPWLALGAAAVIVGPWVLVGSLGSPGTTALNLIQVLPNALNEELLYRGFAFAWLWRAAHRRRAGAIGSLILFVAAQGGAVLPSGDWEAVGGFGAAMLLGILLTELTVRSGGSIWPAFAVHLLYGWFPLAFADPRSREELLHWLVKAWMPLAAGGLGLVLWLGRKLAQSVIGQRRLNRYKGRIAAISFALIAWIVVLTGYVTFGAPGFHPDGFLIFLEERADLGPATTIADPVERRAWVYRALVETAARSQGPLEEELDRLGLTYRSHYLINAIEVSGRPGLRRRFAEWPGVASALFQPGVRPYPRTIRLPSVDPGGPQGVEWNVREIGADRVWDLGFTGQGVVVGNADSGVTWDHPALLEAYLGWDGQQAVHDYRWYDPWDNQPEPWDDNGHGTHTTGTIVGLDGENKVGVAPGAKWIACRNMRHGIGNPGSYLSCMEFLFAPFPLDGDPIRDGDPARGAHVVNNSWGCPAEEGCQPDTLRVAVDNLRAAGQMMVVSAGNDGPKCGTVQDPPAIYDNVLSVGAIAAGDQAASFSGRGPVTADGSLRLKPDVVAPGVDIRSSVRKGYASLPGTSMAGPHVAGAVALLWSMEPQLVGDLQRTESLLIGTTQPLTVDSVCDPSTPAGDLVCACGTDGLQSIPNQVYGWGQIDIWAAAQSLEETR